MQALDCFTVQLIESVQQFKCVDHPGQAVARKIPLLLTLLFVLCVMNISVGHLMPCSLTSHRQITLPHANTANGIQHYCHLSQSEEVPSSASQTKPHCPRIQTTSNCKIFCFCIDHYTTPRQENLNGNYIKTFKYHVSNTDGKISVINN